MATEHTCSNIGRNDMLGCVKGEDVVGEEVEAKSGLKPRRELFGSAEHQENSVIARSTFSTSISFLAGDYLWF